MSGMASLRAQEVRAEVRKELAALGLTPSTKGNRGALRNLAGSTGGTAPTGVTNAMNLVIGACNLKALVSGLFLASFSLALTGITATDTTAVTVTTQTSATAITYGNAARITGSVLQNGPLSGGIYPVPPSNYGAFVSSMAAGITFATGGGGSVTQYATGSQVAGTAATTAEFSWFGFIGNSVANPVGTPFTIGNDVSLVISINSTHSATITYAGFSMFLQEVPG